MGIRRGGRDNHDATAKATSRWTETAATVDERFQQLSDLPLDEAVEVALMRTPGNMNREELARRIAASRGIEPPQR